MAIQKTYNMIKSRRCAQPHVGEIVNRSERAGLTVGSAWGCDLDQAKASYAPSTRGKPFYGPDLRPARS